MLRKLFGRKSNPGFKAVLVDPFIQEIHEITLPNYPVDARGEVADERAFKRALADWNAHVGQNIIPVSTSFRHDCYAIIDDEGLLRSDAAYWRLEVGPEAGRDIRGGRYLIYGSNGRSTEVDVPRDLGVGFWQRNVSWVTPSEAHAWCRARGIPNRHW